MSVKVLLSPTENALAERLKDDAITSSIPEQKGADILIYSSHGLIGLQRKEVPNDFVISMTDGRLSRETSLLAENCQITRLIAEGRFSYYGDGRLVIGKVDPKTKRPEASRFTRNHIRGMIFDIELVKGITIDWTENIDDTAAYIKSLVEFVSKGKHLGLYSRPGVKGVWYVPSAKEELLWLLQGFQGVGPQLAENIIQHFDGRIPLTWSCTLEALRSVSRLSGKRADTMWELLGGSLPLAAESVEGVSSRIDEIRKRMSGEAK